MNAYALAQFAPEQQVTWVDRALTQKPKEFCPAAQDRLQEIKDEGRKGRPKKPQEFAPRSTARKLKDLQAATVDRKFVDALVSANADCKTAADGAFLALQWAQHLDPAGVAEQKAKWDAKKAKLVADKEARKAAKEAEKEAEKEAKEKEAMEEQIAARNRLVHGNAE
jgi:hypothetical protein